MRLSEAILLGATMSPQSFGSYRHDYKTCALGAAAEATGAFAEGQCRYDYEIDLWVMERWPKTLAQRSLCPLCSKSPLCGKTEDKRLLGAIIAHLNDAHYWTREQIADWVATVEVPEATQPTEVAVPKEEMACV